MITYTRTSPTSWTVQDGDNEIGHIQRTDSQQYLCTGKYFQVTLSNWELAKTVFVPVEPQKSPTIKDNQTRLW